MNGLLSDQATNCVLPADKPSGEARRRAEVLIQQISQPRGVRAALYLGERRELYLADALPGDVEALAYLLQGLGLAPGEAEAVLEHHPLPLGEAVQGLAHPGFKEGGLREVVGALGLLVRDKVAELGGVVLADRGLERDGAPADAPDAHDLLRLHLHDAGDLLVCGIAIQLGGQGALNPVVLVYLLDHVDGDPDRAPLVRYRAGDGLPDPPRGVGGELEALAVVELLDRPHEPYVPLLDQVQKRDAPASVLLGDRDDEPQVGLSQVRLRAPVSSLDAPRQVDLLGLGEEGGLADLVQVHLDRVPGVTALEIAFEDLLDELYVLLLVEGLGEKASVHYLDAVLAEQAVDLLDLIGREVDLLKE